MRIFFTNIFALYRRNFHEKCFCTNDTDNIFFLQHIKFSARIAPLRALFALRAHISCFVCLVCVLACFSPQASARPSDAALSGRPAARVVLSEWYCVLDSTLGSTLDSASSPRVCEAAVSEGLRHADSVLSGLAAARGSDRNDPSIDSLARRLREIHNEALLCQAHLTAMMALAASETARKLPQSPNVLAFRMSARDARLFLDEARRYWKERR